MQDLCNLLALQKYHTEKVIKANKNLLYNTENALKKLRIFKIPSNVLKTSNSSMSLVKNTKNRAEELNLVSKCI